MDDKYIKYKNFLNDLKTIDIKKKDTSKTFMQVSGYPHFENVASNILAFFFTSDEEHALNDLFFKSLIQLLVNEESVKANSVVAEREYVTSKNNRIDIVLSTDSYIVGIENKIYSGVQNDLYDYKKAINQMAKSESKKALHIILSIRNEKNIAVSSEFVNITYKMLFDSIKRNLGHYVQSADNTWLIYMKDFMKTIDELQNGGDKMNIELLKFIKENNDVVKEFLDDCNSLKRELSQQTKNLLAIIDLEKYKADMKFSVYCVNPKINITSHLVIDINRGERKTLVVETYIDATGWHIVLWDRFGERPGKLQLEQQLENLKVNYDKNNNGKVLNELFIVVKSFDYLDPFDLIAEEIYRMMDITKMIDI